MMRRIGPVIERVMKIASTIPIMVATTSPLIIRVEAKESTASADSAMSSVPSIPASAVAWACATTALPAAPRVLVSPSSASQLTSRLQVASL